MTARAHSSALLVRDPAMSSPPPHSDAWLEAKDGNSFPLCGNCGLGRSSRNTIVIPSDRASRQHAAIHAQDGGEWWLIDLGSVNGTFLNGRRVGQPTPLHPGDRVGIADFEWTFRRAKESNGYHSDDDLHGETFATIPEIRTASCWLLLADIEGFTPLSRRVAPEILAQMIGRWVRASREAIESQGGTMNKYLGDGFLAFWPDEADSAQRVSAAIQTLTAHQAAGEPPFRIVLHHGRVSLGGGATLGEECLMGPEVNFIFRLEKLAGTLGIPGALSESAASRLAPWISSASVDGDHALKGFDGHHRLFKMTGPDR